MRSTTRTAPLRFIWTLVLAPVLATLLPGAFAQSGFLPVSGLAGPGPVPAGNTTALFAHLAIGGGFTTTFTLLNTGSTVLTGTLILTGQDGAPLSASLVSGNTLASGPTIDVNIQPGGTQFVTASPLGQSVPTAGWARVESVGGTLGGVATFQLVSGDTLLTIAGVLASDLVTAATIPLDDDVPPPANRYTGYAVANPSSTDTVTIKVQTVRGDDGQPAAVLAPVVLGPGKQIASFVFQDPAASRQFKGSVVLIGEGGKSFAVVALVQNQGLYTAIPVIPSKAPHIN